MDRVGFSDRCGAVRDRKYRMLIEPTCIYQMDRVGFSDRWVWLGLERGEQRCG